jgi:hypothetical protein
MSNSTVNTSVSGSNVVITVKIDPSDVLFGWWVRVTSKYDYGYGKGQGVGDYPWIVEIIDGGFSMSYSQTKTYKSGLYAAELNLARVGPVDFSTFELVGVTAKPVVNYSGFGLSNSSGGCSEFDSCTVDPTIATGHVTIMNQVTIPTAGTYTIKNTFRIGSVAYDLINSYNFGVGTFWICSIDSDHYYVAGTTHTHVGAWFV